MSIKASPVEITALEFQCPVCYTIKIPLMCKPPCLHSVCHDCYTSNPNKTHCPICNNNTGTRTDWIRNEFEERILQRFNFSCDDCNQKLTLAQVGKHPDVCVKRQVICTNAQNGCEWQGTLDQLADHDCPFKKLSCKFCNNSFYSGALTEHQEICNYRSWKCSCGKVIYQWQKQFHHHD